MAGYGKPFTSATGKTYAETVAEGRGNYEKEYLNPSTNAQRVNQLYSQYGNRYGWMPINERTSATFGQAPAATPAPIAPLPANTPSANNAIPTVTTKPKPLNVANAAQTFPLITAGQKPAVQKPFSLSIPKFTYNQGKAEAMVNRNSQIGNTMSYAPSLENDPIYQYQKEEGQRALDAKLAGQGLYNSGAGAEANRRLTGQLMADQAQRAQQIAIADQQTQAGLAGQRLGALNSNLNSAINRYGQDINAQTFGGNVNADINRLGQQEGERLQNMQQEEALRLERESNEMHNRYMDFINYIQAGNPMPQASQATDALANIYAQLGQNLPAYMMKMQG